MSAELRYHPSIDQLALTSAFNESLSEVLPIARLHRSEHESEHTWSNLVSLGVLAITLGDEHGGSELGLVEEALIATQLGQCLAAPSVLASMAASRTLIWIGRPPARTAAAYRHDQRNILVSDGEAQFVLLRAGEQSTLHDANFISAPVDDRLWLSPLRECESLPEPLTALNDEECLRLRLLDAAALTGIAETALRMGVAYSLTRNQFGRPIGGFQAVKHHCANMAMAARRARDQTNFAAVALEDGREDAAFQVDCALLVAGEAALENAAKNIQIHGGMGFSDEADPHLVLKRARVYLAIAGGLEAAGARIVGHGERR